MGSPFCLLWGVLLLPGALPVILLLLVSSSGTALADPVDSVHVLVLGFEPKREWGGFCLRGFVGSLRCSCFAISSPHLLPTLRMIRNVRCVLPGRMTV